MPPTAANHQDTLAVTRPSDREIVLSRSFAAPRAALFDALTRCEHLQHWMGSTGMTFADCEARPGVGGAFRYTFQRSSGRRLEVRGSYHSFEPPATFGYTETYDFSPLQVLVTTDLSEADGRTTFRQTLRYATTQERDEDFEGVATSAREAYDNLARYLIGRGPVPR